jgi:hypothetical protein
MKTSAIIKHEKKSRKLSIFGLFLKINKIGKDKYNKINKIDKLKFININIGTHINRIKLIAGIRLLGISCLLKLF